MVLVEVLDSHRTHLNLDLLNLTFQKFFCTLFSNTTGLTMNFTFEPSSLRTPSKIPG